MSNVVLLKEENRAESSPGGLPSHINPEVAPLKLSVKKLRVSYTDLKTGKQSLVVDGIDLDVHKGEFISIVGLSGCGKSTFLYSIAGLLKPDSGTVYVDNQKISGPGPDRAVVFQTPSLLPWRTVWRNVTYGLELRGVRPAAAKIKAEYFIDLVGLNGFENYYPYQLSGGMQQRVNLARALLCDPEVLLLDEPFAALDAITREEMQQELLSICEITRKTIVMVTHQIDEAIFLSDKVLVFSARPAKIMDEIPITLPKPRKHGIKQDQHFCQSVKEIWALIDASKERSGCAQRQGQPEHVC